MDPGSVNPVVPTQLVVDHSRKEPSSLLLAAIDVSLVCAFLDHCRT